MGDVAACVNCGRRIVRVHFALGDSWRHQPEDSAFQDNMTMYCQVTVATPPVEVGE